MELNGTANERLRLVLLRTVMSSDLRADAAQLTRNAAYHFLAAPGVTITTLQALACKRAAAGADFEGRNMMQVMAKVVKVW